MVFNDPGDGLNVLENKIIFHWRLPNLELIPEEGLYCIFHVILNMKSLNDKKYNCTHTTQKKKFNGST